jgi:hypothetical protein
VLAAFVDDHDEDDSTVADGGGTAVAATARCPMYPEQEDLPEEARRGL